MLGFFGFLKPVSDCKIQGKLIGFFLMGVDHLNFVSQGEFRLPEGNKGNNKVKEPSCIIYHHGIGLKKYN
jgi:hypothetical protein